MKLSYEQIFDKAWKVISNQLPLSAGLTIVYLLAFATLSLVPIMGGLAASLLTPGYIICLLKLRDSQHIEFHDFFWSFQNFNRVLHWFVMIFISFIVTFVGFIFLLVPGIYLLVALSLAQNYFVFRQQDGIEAIKASMNIVHQNWWFMFGLMGLIGILNFLGAIFFLLGLLLTIPMSVLLLYFAMEELEKTKPVIETKTFSLDEPVKS